MEAALESACIRITKEGSHCTALPYTPFAEEGFSDTALHCHYRQEGSPQEIRFYLQRSESDLFSLLQEAEALGIRRAVGLYQQIKI